MSLWDVVFLMALPAVWGGVVGYALGREAELSRRTGGDQ